MSVNPYERVPYLRQPMGETHPRRLHAIARLFGIDAAPPENCRVLELGCALGGNIVPMACALPDSHFVGVDLSPSQIAQAKEFARGAEVANVDLRAASILDIS